MKKLTNQTKQEITTNYDLGKKITESILYNGEESSILFTAKAGANISTKGAITTFGYKGKVVAVISIVIQRHVKDTVLTQPVLLDAYEIETKDMKEPNITLCFNKIISENNKKMVEVLENLK